MFSAALSQLSSVLYLINNSGVLGLRIHESEATDSRAQTSVAVRVDAVLS